MRALLHFYGVNDPPIGIWWVNELGNIACYYADGYQPEEAMGRLAMTGKAPQATWSEFFDSLERTLPLGNGWESVELVRATPQEYLDRVRSYGSRSA